MQRQNAAPANEESLPLRAKRWRVIALTIATSYLLILCGTALFGQIPVSSASLQLSDLTDKSQILSHAKSLAGSGLINAAIFFLLGVAVAAAVPRAAGFSGALRMLCASCLFAWLLTAVVIFCRYQGQPFFVQFVVPIGAGTCGAWITFCARWGFALRLSVVAQVILLALGVAIVGQLCLERAPLPLAAPQVTSQQKRRLVEVIKKKKRLAEQEELIRTIRLEEDDVELLTNWGLQIADRGTQASSALIDLYPDRFSTNVSWKLPGEQERYLNLFVHGTVKIDQGRLTSSLDYLRIGQLKVPRLLLPLITATGNSYVRSEEAFARILANTESLELNDQSLSVSVKKGTFSDEVIGQMNWGENPAIAEATMVHLAHLQAFQRSAKEPLPFDAYLKEAFVFASKRTTSDGQDPVIENRGAIYALGIYLGHPRLGKLLIGTQFDPAVLDMESPLGKVPLRGRTDLTRHFTVSSVLAVHANSLLSDAAGLLKEELDSGTGGSGFSFTDLMADRAGTRFGLAATQNVTTAKALQRRLSTNWTVDDLMPPLEGIPEGFSSEELEQQFGGVGGDRYREVIEEIERRLDTCPLLQ